MEELLKLVETVKILSQTVDAMVARQEQLFKMQEEQSQALRALAAEMKASNEAIQVTDEALKQSLSDLDSTTDDLVKTAAALLLLKKEQTNEEQ